MQKLRNVSRPSFKFEHLLIGYISKFKDRLSISILALISQPYLAVQKRYHMGSNYLRPTMQPFSGPFLFDELFSLYKGSTRSWRGTQLEVSKGLTFVG